MLVPAVALSQNGALEMLGVGDASEATTPLERGQNPDPKTC